MIFDLFGLGILVFEISADAFMFIMIAWLILWILAGLYIMRSVELWRNGR
jgi:hypothetical protein